MTDITIYHNPNCGTSRNTLAMIRNNPGVEPIEVTPLGTRLCRPSEQVLNILPDPQTASLTKEDGEVVIDVEAKRV
jgi:arsenate reductase-like glutaredoxin family protein